MICYNKMSQDDLSACATVFQDAFLQPPWHEKWTYEQAYSRIEELMSSNYFRGYIIKDENKVIGMACGRIMTYMHYQEFWLDELCLLNQYQGQHLGSSLLDYIKQELKKENIERIVLNTVKGVLSDVFYQNNGFQENKTIVSMYCDFKDNN